MHPCTCRIAATDPASHGSHPYSSFAQGLAWANNVLEPDRIGWSFDVTTDNPRCAPQGHVLPLKKPVTQATITGTHCLCQ